MELSHVHTGAGAPLLLVHGIGHSHTCWDDVTPRLGGFDAYSVDLPGFGASDPLPTTPTLTALAEACRAFMAARGHTRFHVAGNSLGGGIALHLTFTGIALSACVLSPIGFVQGFAERANVHATLASSRAAAGGVARVIAGAPAPVRRLSAWSYAVHAERLAPQVLADTFAGLAAAPGFWPTRRHALGWRCPPMDALPAPVTVAWGEKDRLLLYGPQSQRARERLPRATHITLDGCGHLPTWDDPARVADVIRATAS